MLSILKNADNVKHLAEDFRKAIESTPKDLLPIGLQKFPRGSCGDATHLLGRYFIDQGCGKFSYVSGRRGSLEDSSWTTHAWLKNNDFLVDITADQFGDGLPKIIVAQESEFHKSFKSKETHIADFMILNDFVRHQLAQAYKAILGNILEHS